MEIREFIKTSTVKLKDKGFQNPSLDIKLLLSYVLNIDIKKLILNSTKKLHKFKN